ncbi:Clp protease N-terminal domain-containing protein [Microbacterium sp. 77mftsu3.1]|uniref:Clp protease N-terminal domain-containing protein n=1 Tax=Microbacterium sp. 77mftsu3.1 TaxID=1761802 RepID=UPI000362B504|nr:Clp protease N-terminal domain-containing protein [Microbacterium sp. 77mftsu3.1]SDH49490.1 Clp amino terminal domain-containing protein, pathogenicity island component [Microbacterium sp. 77mftsu3.1]
MFENFSADSRRAVVIAQEEARGLRQEHIEVTHLVLGVTYVGPGVLSAYGITPRHARMVAARATPRLEQQRIGHIQFSTGTREAIRVASFIADATGCPTVEPEHLLAGILSIGALERV